MSRQNTGRGHRPRRSWPLVGLGLMALVGLGGLGGCAAGQDGRMEIVATPTPAADAALAALAKGRFRDAESWATRALANDPRNPYALLVHGMIAERAGQVELARDAYQTILDADPTGTVNPLPLETNAEPRPLVEIAAARLRALPASPVGPGMARVPGLTGPEAMETPDPGPAAMMGDTGETGMAEADPAWENIARRFEVLERLYREGLVTAEEHGARRRENLGALLPLTQPPPAAGLSRPAPRVETVMGRLRDLADTFERGVLSARQHAEEREAILDALLPADPVRREEASMTPRTHAEAAQLARRLEDAVRRGLISGDQYDRERAALRDLTASMPPDDERAHDQAPPRSEWDTPPATPMAEPEPEPATEPHLLIPPPGQPGVTAGPPTANADDPVTQRFTGVTAATTDGARAVASGQTWVHLASYRERENAEAGWAALSQRYAGIMRGMGPVYDEVTIPGKGVFFRLKAGPVEIPGGAARLCDRLRAAGQFCEPTEAPTP